MANKNLLKPDKKLSSFDKTKNAILNSCLSIAVWVFFYLSIIKSQNTFILEHKTLIFILGGVGDFVLLCLGIIFSLLNFKFGAKLAITINVFILFTVILYFILLYSGFLDKIDSVQDLRNYIESAGMWATFLYILLQFLQVLVLPIPNIITMAVGVAMFGAFKCILYSFIAIVSGSIVAFLIGRIFGYKVACWLVGKDMLDTWLEKVKGKDNIILTAMFLLPLFPDDILCFVAGLSSMKTSYYIVMIIITRLISIAVMALSMDGMLIPYTTWWGLLIWALLLSVLFVFFAWIYKNSEKFEKYMKKFKKQKSKK